MRANSWAQVLLLLDLQVSFLCGQDQPFFLG
jgi:hypothetical protein